MRNVRRLSVAAVLAAAASPVLALPAFPGAEGFGANAAGGRGGDVYHVTTLADDPTHSIPGSLYYGLYEKNVPAAGRTIVFDVGGTISLGSTTLDIKNIHNVTIAGQTAPSPITIINNTTQVTSSSGKETGNIIIQYLTFRKGTGNGDDAFHIQGNGNTHDIMVDHVSGSWSEDEVISATQNANNVTVQNSIMSEALTSNHAFGSLVRPQQNASISFDHNLYSNQKSRNPRPGTYDDATLNFEFQNNVIYNWSDRAGYIAGADGNTQHLNMNYVGNYLIAGPVAVDNSGNPYRRETAFLEELSSSTGSLLDLHIFQQNNKIDSNANALRDGVDTGWNMFRTLQTNGTYTPYTESEKATSPFAFPRYATADPADVAYAKVISSVGAFPYARSDVDRRLIGDVLNYTGFAPITAPDTTEWNNIVNALVVTRPANWDTDGDGMPNWWEQRHGSNPNAADNNALTPSGYTRLETYLQALTAIANWNLDANGNWSDYLNWRGTRPTTENATANFPPGTTAPRTVALDLPVTLTDLSLAGSQAYTLAGANTLTLSTFGGTAAVTVPSGGHVISAPVVLASPTQFDVAGSLTVSHLQASSVGVTKLGTGTLAINAVALPSLTVSAGTVQFLPATGPASVPSVTIATGATLDLTDNPLTTAAAAATVRQLIQSSQLTSSSADATHRLGYIASGPSVLVRLTLAGDANMDGRVDADDYALIDKGLATNASTWSFGDFNYDGTIDQNDYLLIDTSYAIGSASFGPDAALLAERRAQFGDAYVQSLLASVPEPSTVALVMAAALPTVMRRGRRA